jgi:hypothetical protein
MANEVNVALTEQVLANPAFINAVEELKQDYYKNWVLSENMEEREKIHDELMGLLRVQQLLEQRIADFDYDTAIKTKNQETEL